MGSDVLGTMKGKTRKMLEAALLPGETVYVVVNGREGRSISLTDSRIVWAWATNFLLKGNDSVQIEDVLRIGSGVAGMSINMKSGDETTFDFWPTSANRQAAQEFVQMVRAAQARKPVPAQRNVADELTKLAQLRDQGVLTDREFEVQKATLLG